MTMKDETKGEGMTDIQYPKIAWGWTSLIYRIPDSRKVVKVIDTDKVVDKKRAKEHFERELAAYWRLSGPDTDEKVVGSIGSNRSSNILEFFGTDASIPHSLVLGLAENGSLDRYLWDRREMHEQPPPDRSTILKWARQATEALVSVHDHNILHCDIYVSNFMLDSDLNLKLGDFGACTIDGSRPLMTYRATHQLWLREGDEEWQKEISVKSEIFALGCTIFWMEAGKDALDGLDRNEEKARVRARDMGSVEAVPVLGSVVQRCWDLAFSNMRDVLEAVEETLKGGLSETSAIESN